VAKTTVQQLAECGQSVWLDYISRSLIDTGILKQFIDAGVAGLTSNPSIFDNAVSKSDDYDDFIGDLKQQGKSTFDTYDEITVRDIQDAADLFLPVYRATRASDGCVSLEIDPRLAHDIEPTIAEGKRLFENVKRPNLMLKVPATKAGYTAIPALLAQGINVNVTLIFSRGQYIDAAEAYLQGLERLLENGGDVSTVRSVASVFVSRVDTLVDKLIDSRVKNGPNQRITDIKGRAAVANATLIFDQYQETFSGERFRHLAKEGAGVQRLLWGSTSTKNPAYSDIKYVTELIGENTINTIPQVTLEAFLDHGKARKSLPGDRAQAEETLARLQQSGIDIDEVCRKLLDDGVAAFQRAFDSLLEAIAGKAQKLGK
jgi:transaldolase/transaldolase/glucose-6-phosphate isomerase